jgi:ankyrin repeat protein
LQAIAKIFRRFVRALVLPVVVLALIFAAPTNAFAADTDDLLSIAAASGNTADVEFLLDDGVDVNHRLSNGATALVMASWNGHRKTVEALLARGAAINVQAETGETALFLASMNNHRETVEVLLAKGAALDMQTNKGGATALIIASYQGHTQIVATLLAAGANTEVQLRNGKTAIDFSKNAAIFNMLRAAAKP